MFRDYIPIDVAAVKMFGMIIINFIINWYIIVHLKQIVQINVT